MSQIYLPLMLNTLIEQGGRASARDIGAAFLRRDESQLDYYAEIVRRMPGSVLAKQGLVQWLYTGITRAARRLTLVA